MSDVENQNQNPKNKTLKETLLPEWDELRKRNQALFLAIMSGKKDDIAHAVQGIKIQLNYIEDVCLHHGT